MEKEFIPYEQALALKELGFDEKCCACYGSYTHKKSELFLNINNPINIETLLREPTAFNQPSFYVKSPTFSQAFRWFREKYKISGEISSDYYLEGKDNEWEYNIYQLGKEDDGYVGTIPIFKTPEEAELECLKKLIEIVKEK
jgi:hypothetical protein